MELGDSIKQIRKYRGYTQKEIAKKCGISHNALCSIEKNKSFPSKSTFDKILGCLDVPASTVLLLPIIDLIKEKKRYVENALNELLEIYKIEL